MKNVRIGTVVPNGVVGAVSTVVAAVTEAVVSVDVAEPGVVSTSVDMSVEDVVGRLICDVDWLVESVWTVETIGTVEDSFVEMVWTLELIGTVEESSKVV